MAQSGLGGGNGVNQGESWAAVEALSSRLSLSPMEKNAGKAQYSRSTFVGDDEAIGTRFG